MHPLVEALLPALSGTLVLGGFGAAVWGLYRHRSAEGPLVRGLRVWSAPLPPALVDGLRRLPERADGDWGWARREGDLLVVFADPTSSVDGLRVRTPWPYRVVVRLDEAAPAMAYHAPTAFLLLGLPVLPVVAMSHLMQVGRIEARLMRLAGRAAGEPA